MSSTPAITDPTTWALDREIVLVRVLDAARDAVFAAWTDADAFCQWFGPEGFTCTVREMDVRPGGRARFDMISGDGTVFTNRFDYLEVVPGERLVLDHGSDVDDDPARFRVTITLDEQADGKTVLTLRQLHPTVEQRRRSHRLRRGRARSADDAEARSPSRRSPEMSQLVRVQNFLVSRDGFGAGRGPEPRGALRPRRPEWGVASLPADLASWAFATASWPNRTEPGGSRGLDDYFTRDYTRNIGAEIMGRNKFGPAAWPVGELRLDGVVGRHPALPHPRVRPHPPSPTQLHAGRHHVPLPRCDPRGGVAASQGRR